MSEETNPRHKYSLRIAWSDEDNAFIATCQEFHYLMAHGSTWEEAAKMAELALGCHIEGRVELNVPLPEPKLFKWEERYG